jgi:hypothetical protein
MIRSSQCNATAAQKFGFLPLNPKTFTISVFTETVSNFYLHISGPSWLSSTNLGWGTAEVSKVLYEKYFWLAATNYDMCWLALMFLHERWNGQVDFGQRDWHQPLSRHSHLPSVMQGEVTSKQRCMYCTSYFPRMQFRRGERNNISFSLVLVETKHSIGFSSPFSQIHTRYKWQHSYYCITVHTYSSFGGIGSI